MIRRSPPAQDTEDGHKLLKKKKKKKADTETTSRGRFQGGYHVIRPPNLEAFFATVAARDVEGNPESF